MLEDRDNELRSMVYNTQLPINIGFNAVEDCVDFADLVNQTLTSNQTIAKAYVILNKTRRFKNDITAWNRRPETDKTWEGFKTHFRRAHQDFRETTDVTLEDSELQRSNANLVQQVVNGMQQAMVAETNTDANAALLLQASEANQLLNTQIQQMQQSMNLLQTRVANQGSTQPYVESNGCLAVKPKIPKMTYAKAARVSDIVEAQDRLIANGCDPTTSLDRLAMTRNPSPV